MTTAGGSTVVCEYPTVAVLVPVLARRLPLVWPGAPGVGVDRGVDGVVR